MIVVTTVFLWTSSPAQRGWITCIALPFQLLHQACSGEGNGGDESRDNFPRRAHRFTAVATIMGSGRPSASFFIGLTAPLHWSASLRLLPAQYTTYQAQAWRK